MRKLLWSAMILLAASLTCSAELIAHYTFDGANPLENKANPGTFDLIHAGTSEAVSYTTNGVPGGVTGSAIDLSGGNIALRSGSIDDFSTSQEKPIIKVSFWIKPQGEKRDGFPFAIHATYSAGGNDRVEFDARVADNKYQWYTKNLSFGASERGDWQQNVWMQVGFEYDRRDQSIYVLSGWRRDRFIYGASNRYFWPALAR